MKSLLESIFDKDLVQSYPWGPLDEWMNNGREPESDNYVKVIKYILSKNPKCPYPQYDWQMVLTEFPKEIRPMIKDLKDVYMSVQTRVPSTVLYFDSENKDDVYSDLEGDELDITPLDNMADDIGHLAYLGGDDIARFGKLDRHWSEAIRQYNEYYNIPMPDFSCPYWVAVVDDVCLFMIGFPKNTPVDVLKLFRIQ